MTMQILAGNYREASMWAAGNGLAAWQWRFVADRQWIHGCRDFQAMIVGTFWQRDDATELIQRCEAAGASIADKSVVKHAVPAKDTQGPRVTVSKDAWLNPLWFSDDEWASFFPEQVKAKCCSNERDHVPGGFHCRKEIR